VLLCFAASIFFLCSVKIEARYSNAYLRCLVSVFLCRTRNRFNSLSPNVKDLASVLAPEQRVKPATLYDHSKIFIEGFDVRISVKISKFLMKHVKILFLIQ
jgi:hypothetical protein